MNKKNICQEPNLVGGLYVVTIYIFILERFSQRSNIMCCTVIRPVSYKTRGAQYKLIIFHARAGRSHRQGTTVIASAL